MLIPILALLASAFVLFESDRYSFEIPKGWNVGNETPWGARDMTPQRGKGKLGAMTAGPTSASWDELYRTSLFFIKREAGGTETPYRIGKTKQGYESISFEVINEDGWADRRYTLLRNDSGFALALSVKIPSRDLEKQYIEWFQHMVDTARLK
jgi:hypothetical protein